MMFERVGDIVSALPGAVYSGLSSAKRRRVRGLTTDSRSLKTGEVFVALVGERFDGHEFVASVVDRAAAVIVSSSWASSHALGSAPAIIVEDTLTAYGDLATAHRSRFSIPVVAVAGSNGKTTTKDLLSEVLAKKYTVLRTEGNLNNLIGAPATLLRLAAEHEVAVIEIGTNTPGEIDRLSEIVRPTHGVITNIGREHLELLGSLEGVANEEGALFGWLAANGGTAFVNLDDPHLRRIGRRLPRRVTFGRAPTAEIRGVPGRPDASGAPSLEVTDQRGGSDRRMHVQLRTPGAHTAANALAATAVALDLGVRLSSVRAALASFQPRSYTTGYARLAVIRSDDGVTVLNDTYNANPDSLDVALRTLKSMRPGRGGRRIVALADMLELGSNSGEEHGRVAAMVEGSRASMAYYFGPEMKRAHDATVSGGRVLSRHFKDRAELARDLRQELRTGDVVLVKGSRGMRMEEVVTVILRKE